MEIIWTIIAGFFAVGAVGTWAGARRKTPAEKRQRWLKLVVYLFITAGLIALMLYWPVAMKYWAMLLGAGVLAELWLVREAQPRKNAIYVGTTAIVLPVIDGYWQMMAHLDQGVILYVFLIVFSFDGFCQVTGQLIGKTRLFPVISPNKTVEGLIGGTLVAVGLAVYTAFWVDVSPVYGVLNGLVLCATALWGDYLASWYKRRHGVKDYNELIPGHGGLLDRFDSWLMAGAWVGLFGLFHG